MMLLGIIILNKVPLVKFLMVFLNLDLLGIVRIWSWMFIMFLIRLWWRLLRPLVRLLHLRLWRICLILGCMLKMVVLVVLGLNNSSSSRIRRFWGSMNSLLKWLYVLVVLDKGYRMRVLLSCLHCLILRCQLRLQQLVFQLVLLWLLVITRMREEEWVHNEFGFRDGRWWCSLRARWLRWRRNEIGWFVAVGERRV